MNAKTIGMAITGFIALTLLGIGGCIHAKKEAESQSQRERIGKRWVWPRALIDELLIVEVQLAGRVVA